MRLTRLSNISLAKAISLAALTALAIAVAIGFLADSPSNATAFNADVPGGGARHVPIPAQYTAQCSSGIAVPDPANNPGLVADCAALLASKDTLEGTDGNLNWSANRAIRDWNGVYVYVLNGRVSSLVFSSENLNGTIPAELGNLDKLEGLWLSGNELTGAIPSQLGNLANLVHLDLSGNELTGVIPSQLGNLANLMDLQLHNNRLTGAIPAELGNLANLVVLGLSGNELTGAIPSQLGNLANLDRLHLHNNFLTGAIPSQLGNLANLRDLSLSGNQFTGCISQSLRSPLGEWEIELIGLPICVAPTPTHTVTPVSYDALMSRLTAIERQVAELAESQAILVARVAQLEGGSAASATPTPTTTPASVIEASPTPTATPSPTPTSVPGASAGNACIERLADSGRVSETWDDNCLSTNSPDDGNTYYARFYTFTLVAAADVTITLSAAKPPYIYLLDGVGRDGDVLQGAGDSSQTSQAISASLQAGSYTIEASTWNPNVTGDFTLTLDTGQ